MSEFAEITTFDGAVAYKRGLRWVVEWPSLGLREDRWGGFTSVRVIAEKKCWTKKRAEAFMRARRRLAAAHNSSAVRKEEA